MTKMFLTSVADVRAYDENDNLILIGKTLMDSSIESTLSSTDIRGGKGNQLLYVFFNGGDLNVTLTETQFNLGFLAATVGNDIVTGANVYTEETVTLGAGGTGTVVGTPLGIQSATLYGWVSLPDETIERVTFTGSNFTASGGSENDVVCVRYYALDSAARQVVVPANAIPKILRLELDAQLASSDESTNIIGSVQVIVPKATLSGQFTLSMTADGVANTPLTARALAFTLTTSAGCTNTPVYAYINEIITNANWYDSVIALAIVGGDFALTHPDTSTIEVRAIPSVGAAFRPPYADLTFSSGTVGTATISAAGLVTTVAAGTTLLKATITAKNTIEGSCTLTVS